MKLFSKIALATATVSIASFASAASISGSTDFRVTLPEILVLYHWDDAHLTLTDIVTTTDNDSDPREISDATTHDLEAALADGAYTLNGDVDTTSPIAKFDGGTVDVTLKNSWAVRSLSNAPVTLKLTNPNATLQSVVENSTATIKTQDALLASTAANVTGTDSTTMTIPSGWDPVMGDIKFKLDLSNANNSGEYNTRGKTGKASDTQDGSDTFLLTLTGNANAQP